MPTETVGENTGDDYGGNSIDAFLDENAPTTNNGGSTEMAFRSNSGFAWNPVVSFPDITGITGPVTVSASSINLYQTASTATMTIEARKLLRDWVELETTFNKASTTPNLDWTTGGAQSDGNDRNAAVSASGSWDNTNDEYKSISGSQLNTDCETDINGGTNHYGFVLQRSDGTGFDNKKARTLNTGDGVRPFLSVTYTAGGGTTYEVTTEESFSLSDASSVSLILESIVAESFNLSDSSSALLTAETTVSENFSLSDVQSAIAEFFLTTTESFALTDNSIYSDDGTFIGGIVITATGKKVEITVTAKKPGITGGGIKVKITGSKA